MSPKDKPLTWLGGEIKTPPLGHEARLFTGFLLRRLQQGQKISMPHSRPMSYIGPRCHELRVPDRNATWRIIYRVDQDAIIILEVFGKKTAKTPEHVIKRCKRRIVNYDDLTER